MLSKGLNASLLPDEFISQVAELLTQDQKLAERHILRYPDLALQVLRGASIVQTENQAVREIARVYGKTIGSDAYLTLLDERVTRLENYSTYEEARKAFVGLTKQKQWLVAAGVDLPAALPANASPLLQLDAFHLTAEVQIKSGRPVAGKETLEKALSFASVNPHHQAYLLLMYSDVLRRNRQHEQANQIWNEAVQLAGELLKQEPGIADPTLWNRCAYHRPGNQAWPQSIQEQLGTFNKRRERIKNLDLMLRRDNLQMIASGESAVWTYVGHCHLERGEPESALLAFKRAEAWSNKLRVRDNLHLLQAEAFLQMDEKTPALAILSRLATKPAPDVSSAALALLGAIKLKEGNIDQSLAFLQKAVEKAPAIQWPGRAEAEANLGLAYLSVGKEEKGLRWLHSGQRRFENNQAKAQLRQSLHNEMIYLENAGKVQEAIAVQERLRSLKMNS